MTNESHNQLLLLLLLLVICSLLLHAPRKSGKVSEFESDQKRLRESGKSQGKCVLTSGM